MASPNMVPAVTPGITTSARSSPLIPPMIPINTSLRDPPTLSPIPQSPLSNDNTPMPRRSATVDHGAPATRDSDYFSLRGRRPSVSAAPPVPVPPSPDDFGSWGTPAAKQLDPNLPTPSTPGGLMGRLKAFGKIPKRSGTDTPGAATPGTNHAMEVTTPAVSLARILACHGSDVVNCRIHCSIRHPRRRCRRCSRHLLTPRRQATRRRSQSRRTRRSSSQRSARRAGRRFTAGRCQAQARTRGHSRR